MDTDVIVVGAGPVGLMLGCELARRGVSHILLESKPVRENYCKALGVAPRTMELFDHLGVLDEVHRRGFYFTGMNIVAGGQLVRRIEPQDPDLPYGSFALAQPETEKVLEEYWRRYGQTIRRGSTVTGLEQSSSGVKVTLAGGEELRARYAVGCDGAHSTVRKILGASFEGDRYPLTFVLGDVRLGWDRPHTENWQFIHMENGELRNVVTVIANPTEPAHYRVSAAVQDTDGIPEHPSLEVLQEVFGPALPEGTSMSELRWSSRYSISHRIVSRYSEDRVFLAGDAAHIHPPIGGLGMNTGLQDAYNLGWKLAAVVNGHADESVLRTYHQERYPVGQRVVEVTAARMDKAMGRDEGKPEPPQFDSQLRIRYEPGLLVAGEAPAEGMPRPGERLPSVEGLKRPYVAGGMRLAELFRDGRFHLFSEGVEGEAFHQVVERYPGELFRCWSILEADAPGEKKAALLDPHGEWSKQVGRGAVLVRPDGVIGWRGDQPEALQAWLDGFLKPARAAVTA